MDQLNILNAVILFLIAIYVLQGAYKGFLVSVGNTIGMGVSWVMGIVFAPMLAGAVAKGWFYNFLLNLTEGSARIANQAQGNLIVSSLSEMQIKSIVSSSAENLPQPFAKLIQHNMLNLVFFNDGYTTVNEYFNYTVANVVVNIFTFLIIYCLSRVVIGLVINAVNFASPFPVLRYCDSLAGAGVGVVRGFMGMFAITMLVPVVLIAAPTGVSMFSDFIFGSSLMEYFYTHNFLLDLISGVITPA